MFRPVIGKAFYNWSLLTPSSSILFNNSTRCWNKHFWSTFETTYAPSVSSCRCAFMEAQNRSSLVQNLVQLHAHGLDFLLRLSLGARPRLLWINAHIRIPGSLLVHFPTGAMTNRGTGLHPLLLIPLRVPQVTHLSVVVSASAALFWPLVIELRVVGRLHCCRTSQRSLITRSNVALVGFFGEKRQRCTTLAACHRDLCSRSLRQFVAAQSATSPHPHPQGYHQCQIVLEMTDFGFKQSFLMNFTNLAEKLKCVALSENENRWISLVAASCLDGYSLSVIN